MFLSLCLYLIQFSRGRYHGRSEVSGHTADANTSTWHRKDSTWMEIPADNNLKLTFRLVKGWFNGNKVNILPWPAQSSDLNPIEHLWEEVDRCVRGENYCKEGDLMAAIEREWMKIPLCRIIKLIDSMPSRCQTIIRAKGFATKY